MDISSIEKELAAPVAADEREELERRAKAYAALSAALRALDLGGEEPSLPPSLEERP